MLETEIVHQAPHTRGDHDRLARRDRAERAAVQVIEMGVGDQDQVDVGQVVDGKPRALEALDDDEPVGPVGSTRILCRGVWMRNEAWPIQVKAICPGCSGGKTGRCSTPDLRTKSEGISTSVMKLR